MLSIKNNLVKLYITIFYSKLLLFSKMVNNKLHMNRSIYLLLLCYQGIALTNYIVNGNFENPFVGTEYDSKLTVLGTTEVFPWEGNFDLMGVNYANNNFGYDQYVDLEHSSNGWISQVVTLPYNGTYYLSFLQRPAFDNYASLSFQVQWNNITVFTFSPTHPNITNITLQLDGNAGNNKLLFREIGLIQDSHGSYIDEMQLILGQISNQHNSSAAINITEIVMNGTADLVKESHQQLPLQILYIQQAYSWISLVPLNQIPVIKYCTMFLDDLWLYPYDKRSYRNVFKEIVQAIRGLEKIKWNLINQTIKINLASQQDLISNYTQFSRKRVVQTEQSDQNLFHVLFPWFTFELTLNIGICLINLIIFNFTFQYYVSKFFRRYSFFVFCLIQTILHSNFANLVYLCFAQLEIFFSFTFIDKLSMIFAVFVFFIIILFYLTFYMLLGKFLKAQACYFIFCFYRCNASYLFLTIRFVVRGFLRGAIHFFIDENNDITQKLCICLVEIGMIGLTLYLQLTKAIFIKKSLFPLFLLYHLAFIALNLYLIIELSVPDEQSLLYPVEQCLLYSLFGISVLVMTLDFIPNHFMKLNPENQNQSQNIESEKESKKRSLLIITLD